MTCRQKRMADAATDSIKSGGSATEWLITSKTDGGTLKFARRIPKYYPRSGLVLMVGGRRGTDGQNGDHKLGTKALRI
jgi:hypothetical protein